MEIVESMSVTEEHDGYKDTRMFVEHNPQEIEENSINRQNVSNIFTPKFIPYYGSIAKQYNLTPTDALIYGFIDFYSSSCNGRFYFTNSQLASIVNCSIDSASRSISKLEKIGLIKTKRKVLIGGGQTRFIEQQNSDSSKTTNPTRQKLQTNNNNINNNIYISNDIYSNSPSEDSLNAHQREINFPLKDIVNELNTLLPDTPQVPTTPQAEFGNADINFAKEWLISKYPKPLTEINDRTRLKNFIQALTPRKGKDIDMSPDWRYNLEVFMRWYLAEKKGFEVENLYKLNKAIQSWREYLPVNKPKQTSGLSRFKTIN